MNWYIEPYKKYAVFTGRSGRKEFWTFTIVNIIIGIILINIDNLIGTYTLIQYSNGFCYDYGWLHGLFSLAVLIPGIAVMVRRLHDTSRSGFIIFLALIPIIGFIILLIFMLLDSTPAENQYGKCPKDELT